MDISVFECPTWREKQKTSDKRIILVVIKSVKTEKTNTKGKGSSSVEYYHCIGYIPFNFLNNGYLHLKQTICLH